MKKTSADGEDLDVFLGPDLKSELVFVVNQVDPETGEFDEHKCLIGFSNANDAKRAYLSNYPNGWGGLGNMTTLTVEEFRSWYESSETETEPLHEHDVLELKPAKRDGEGKLVMEDGAEVPSHIKTASIPKSWTDILLNLNEAGPVWLRAKENGQQRTVYNPNHKLATGFARTREAMHHLQDIPNNDILRMAMDDAVEAPFTRDDLLAALVTRLAGQSKRKEGTDMEDHVRNVASSISKQLGVPARVLVEEYISPAVWS